MPGGSVRRTNKSALGSRTALAHCVRTFAMCHYQTYALGEVYLAMTARRAPSSIKREWRHASPLMAKAPGIFCCISCYCGVGSTCRTQALDQQRHAACRDRACDFVIRHACAHPAQHATDTQRDLG